jgi:hypothetical protein
MNLRVLVSCGLVCAAVLVSGCDQGRQAPGRTTVQVANAAAGFPSLQFQRERDTRSATELAFKATQTYSYDADSYDFFATEPTFVNDPGRVFGFAQTLEADKHYTFVLTEVAGEVKPVVIANPTPPASEAQIIALNAASGLPAVDLYLVRGGVGIAGATPLGTMNAQEQIAPRALPSGDYQLFLTAAGNPAAVLLTSLIFDLQAGTSTTIVVVAENGESTAPVSALLLQPAARVLIDVNAPSEMRAINAAPDRDPRDLAVNSQFTPPLFSAMAFGEPTPYARIPSEQMQINVTPVGNPGVLELDTPFTAFVGQRITMLFNGAAGTLVPVFASDDLRRFNRHAKLRFMNAASQFVAIDFVLTAPGGDPNVVFPQATLLSPGISSFITLTPGEQDLYLYASGTLNILSGPTRISVDAGGLYSILAVDGPDTTTANIVYLDDFP